MPAIYHEGGWIGNATDPEVLVKDTVGWTGKNLLPNKVWAFSLSSGSVGSATYQANANATGFCCKVEKNKDYIISRKSSTDANKRFTVVLSENEPVTGGACQVVFATPAETEYSFNSGNYEYVFLYCGLSLTDMDIRPMLRKADITDPTYEPYHESVEVMYEEEIHGVNIATAYPNYALIGDATIGFQILSNKTGGLLYIAPIKHNTSYIASKAQVGNRFRIVLFKNEPSSAATTDAYQVIVENDTDRTSYEFTNTDYNYAVFATAGEGGGGNVNTTNGMIRLATIEDSTYRPYNPQAIQNQLNAQGVLGAKNLLNHKRSGSTTIQGITYTVNADLSISTSGTANANNNSWWNLLPNGITLPAGKYIISDNGNLNTPSHRLSIRLTDNTYVALGTSSETEVTLTATNQIVEFSIGIAKGQASNNYVFKPMIRLASDPDDTYQPYTMTNRELTEKKINIADLKTVVSASSDFADFKTKIASL